MKRYCARIGLLIGSMMMALAGNLIALGAAIVGPQAGELIQPWCLALSKRLKISALASFVPPYPTLGEASKRAAGNYFTETLFGPRTRGLVRFLARLPVW